MNELHKQAYGRRGRAIVLVHRLRGCVSNALGQVGKHVFHGDGDTRLCPLHERHAALARYVGAVLAGTVQHKRAQRHSTAVSGTLAYGVAGVAYLMSLDTFFVLTSCC